MVSIKGLSAVKKKAGGRLTIRGCSSVCGFTPTAKAWGRRGRWRGVASGNQRGDGFEKWENRIRNPSRAGWNRPDDERDANGNSGWSRDWKNCRNCVPASRERG